MRPARLELAALLALQLGLGSPYLHTVPRFYMDEAWEASLGHSLAYEAALRHGIIEGWGGMHVHFVQNQVVLPFLCAAAYKLFGFGIVESRMTSLLVSLLAVAGIHGVMRRWFDRRAALWITLATIVNPWFFEISRRVRPEIYYLALSFAALAAWLGATESRSRAKAAAAGVLAGLSALSHPTGVVLMAALVVTAWRRPFPKRLAAWTLAAFVAMILPYVAYVLWATRDPNVSFLAQMRAGHGVLRSDPSAVVRGEFHRWGHFFQWPYGAPLAATFATAWLIACWRGGRDRAIALGIAFFAACMPLTTVNTTSRYLIAIMPLFIALSVRMLLEPRDASGAARSRFPARFRHAAAGIYVLACAGAIGLMFQRLHDADVRRLFDRVAAVTGPRATVFGSMMFWMGGERYRYGPYPLDEHWNVPADAVRRHRFDYAVRSAWSFDTSAGIAAPPARMPDFRPENAIDEVCHQYGRRIAEFRDPHYGPIEIYKLDWGGQMQP